MRRSAQASLPLAWIHQTARKPAMRWIPCGPPIAKPTTRDARTHLVGRVGDADVEVRQVRLDEVTDDDVEFPLLRPSGRVRPVSAAENRPTTRFGCTHFPCTRFVSSAAMRGSISTAVHCLHFSRMRTVRLPVPGPTSSTTSDGRKFALSTILQGQDSRHQRQRSGDRGVAEEAGAPLRDAEDGQPSA